MIGSSQRQSSKSSSGGVSGIKALSFSSEDWVCSFVITFFDMDLKRTQQPKHMAVGSKSLIDVF